MKTGKMLYLDVDLINAVKEPLSALVNRLLEQYIDTDALENMTKEQCEAELECNRLTREYTKKMKELRKNATK